MQALLRAREQARAATLNAAVEHQRARMQLQAEVASLTKPIDPDIADLADHFNLDETLARSLDQVMAERPDTYEADFMTVWDNLERAKDPGEKLARMIRDLADGTFVVRCSKHLEINKLCEKYKLDGMATRNILEAMAIRERDPDLNISKDLEQLEVHLAHSNAPSKLISMKLKEIRGGCNIGSVWHCCGDSKKKPKERPNKEVPIDGGIGIEGVRGQGVRHGTYKSMTDEHLEKRDLELSRKVATSGSRGGAIMSEKEALKMMQNMRKKDEESQRSRSRHDRSRHRLERREDRRDDMRSHRDDSRSRTNGRGRSRSRGRREDPPLRRNIPRRDHYARDDSRRRDDQRRR